VIVVILSALSIIGLNRSVDMLLQTFTGKDLDVYFDMMEGKWYQKWTKPFITCVYCMASVWGTIFYFTWSFLYGGGVLGWIPSIFAIAGTVHVLLSFEND